jgi:hypothetical protein
MFIDHKEVVNLVLCSAELFENTDVFAGSPGCIDRYIEVSFLFEEEGEFGEDWVGMFSDGGFEGVDGIV